MNKTNILLILVVALVGCTEVANLPRIVPLGKGWSQNSVNAVIFRRNAVVSHEGFQYVAYYDADSSVVLAKRKLGSTGWETSKTRFKGKVTGGKHLYDETKEYIDYYNHQRPHSSISDMTPAEKYYGNKTYFVTTKYSESLV